MAVEILDNRERITWVPAVEVLEAAIPYLEASALVGIRRIVLFDDDPFLKKTKTRAAARYQPIGRTRRADVFVFFWHLDSLEPELKSNQMYIAYVLAKYVAHELHHHLVRGQRIKRRPKNAKEERDADKYSQLWATRVAHQLFPKEKHPEMWDSMRTVLARRAQGEA